MIFLDTSFLVSYKIENDGCHQAAVKIAEEIISGKYGSLIISDYIFDETVTVIFSRSKSLSIGIHTGNELRDSIEIIRVDDSIFENAWDIFKGQKNTRFSFTDCTTLAVMARERIKNIASFDKDFRVVKEINVVGG